MPWTAVVPVKRLTAAKTRLSAAPDSDRQALALAFARDTVSALLTSGLVEAVVVVTDDPSVEEILRGPRISTIGEPGGGGLNEALVHGAMHLLATDNRRSILAVCADLPALRATEVTEALTAAEAYERGFVVDHGGTGTTLLTARRGAALDPRFGIGSAEAHRRSGALEIEGALPSLRQDVDSSTDLEAAVRLGVGAWTARVLGLELG